MSRRLLAAIYIRVSTKKQLENGHGVNIQREKCEALIVSKGWKQGKVYEDLGISGTLDETSREGLNQLLIDAKNMEFDVVVFKSLNRIGRSAKIVLETINKLTNYGVNVASCEESFDTTNPHGKCVLNIFAALAELQHATMLENLKMGREFRRSNIDGDIGGNLPYGYIRIKKKTHIESTAAKNINRIYRLSLIIKKKDSEIIRILNSENIPSPSGKKWGSTSFRRILHDHRDKYMGGFREMSEFRWPKILEADVIEKIVEEGNLESLPSFCGKNGEYVENKEYEDMVWYRAKTEEEKAEEERQKRKQERENRPDRYI